MSFPEAGSIAIAATGPTIEITDPAEYALLLSGGGFELSLALDFSAVTDLSMFPDDPKAMLRWSNDGGRTWSNESWASIGRVGQYRSRVRWRRLGRARDRVFELTISDPVKVVILGASLISQKGTG